MGNHLMKRIIMGLTISRILLAPFVLFSFTYGKYAIGISLFLLTRITDILDGFLARRYKSETKIGALIDQIADRIVMIALTVGFFLGSDFPLMGVLVFVLRDTIFIAGNVVFFLRGQSIIQPSIISMGTTLLQFIAMTGYYFLFFEKIILIISIIFTVASCIEYVLRVREKE